MYHIPVLLQQSVEGLNIKPNGIYVDATYGGGGHAKLIMEQLNEQGRLVGFDQDQDALQNNTLDDERFLLINENFRDLKRFLRANGIEKIDGIMADLGVSSHQFDDPQRGFLFRENATLDMRMDTRQIQTAKDILNNYTEEQLTTVFKNYGELSNAYQIAKAIGHQRLQKPIETNFELKQTVKKLMPYKKENQFLAQLFQAIRIELNDEIETLKDFLKQTVPILNPNGRLVVLSYHSLEDRLVKNFIRSGNFEGTIEKDFFGNVIKPFSATQSKPIVPNQMETTLNTRARSAKLRIATKL